MRKGSEYEEWEAGQVTMASSSHPFPQNAREWMGHPNNIYLPEP